jgi:UDP-N-acetylmuramyl pentapeptide phosphotransferase/UDP-N-acetylglucosamine-1-phosphate transferase
MCMQIPYYSAWIIQLILNIFIILLLGYILFKVLKLIFRVRKDKEGKINKAKEIKQLLIALGIVVIIFTTTNIFFNLDPFNLIEIPLGEYIFKVEGN